MEKEEYKYIWCNFINSGDGQFSISCLNNPPYSSGSSKHYRFKVRIPDEVLGELEGEAERAE